MDNNEMIFELLQSISNKQDKQGDAIARVEGDLKYHIHRTDLLEDSMKLKSDKTDYKKIAVIIGTISTIIGIVVALKAL